MISVSAVLQRHGFTFDVNFTSTARVLGLFGASGAGKTTLINIIAGLDTPDAGNVTVDAFTYFDSAARRCIAPHRRSLGVVFQEHRLFPHLNAEKNLRFGDRARHGHDARQAEERFQRCVTLLELGRHLRKRVHELSGGERQRVALGRALLCNPRMLLLDEPLASIDKQLRGQILPYLRMVHDEFNLPMVYVSHDLTEILQLTDELLVLDNGKVAGQGRFVNIVHDDRVLNAVRARGIDNVLQATIASHHEDDGITRVVIREAASMLLREQARSDAPTPQVEIVAPRCNSPIGSRIAIAIHPWDIALAKQQVQGVSIQNQLQGNVTRITTHDRSALVEVDIGAPLLVEVSNRSAIALGLKEGLPIVCLIKSHAVRLM